MRRIAIGLLTVTLPLLMFSLLLTGCGKKPDEDDEPLPSKKPKKTTIVAPKKTLLPVKATEYGTITGKITWEGDKPDLAALTAGLQESIRKSQDKTTCLSGKEYETTQQAFRIGKNKGVGNVFVWLVPEAGHYFEIPADQLDKFKNTTVKIHQPHCAFLPHSTVLFPSYYKDGNQVLTGQQLVVENDAPIGHNSHLGGSLTNPTINSPLAAGAEKAYTLKPEAKEISVSCDIHGWMKAYIRVFSHPYAAVSSVGADLKNKVFENDDSPDFGTYEIKGVPVNAKVHIIAWHESGVYLAGDKGRELTIKKENKDVNLEMKQ